MMNLKKPYFILVCHNFFWLSFVFSFLRIIPLGFEFWNAKQLWDWFKNSFQAQNNAKIKWINNKKGIKSKNKIEITYNAVNCFVSVARLSFAVFIILSLVSLSLSLLQIDYNLNGKFFFLLPIEKSIIYPSFRHVKRFLTKQQRTCLIQETFLFLFRN